MFNAMIERSRSIRVGGAVDALLGVVGVHARPADAAAGTDAGEAVAPAEDDAPALQHDGAHGPAHPYTTRPGAVSGTSLLSTAAAAALALQNANLSPVRFPGGKNPYLDRPLPPPPPPKNQQRNVVPFPSAPVMPPRPSTSSGPSDKMSGGLSGMPSRPNFDSRRISRDDSFLTSRTEPQRKVFRPFKIGVKSGMPPTPEPSPESLVAPAPAFLPARMQTPESLNSGEIQIGMALGSPAAAPNASPSWQTQSSQIVTSPPPMQTGASLPQRTKTQRRRLFGGLFGSKKTAEPVAAAYSNDDASSAVVSIMTSTAALGSSTPTRSLTVSERRNPSKHKPIVVRSNTISSPSPLMDRSPALAAALAPAGPPSLALGSLLDVEIPDIRLERYSVMFSGVLNPHGAPSRSSLLQRRQATLEKLKTVNDDLELELEKENEKLKQRRATSPQPLHDKSPAFTLFPATPGRAPSTQGVYLGQNLGRSPRARSNTSPALLPSPSRPTFESDAPLRKEKKSVKIVSPRTMDEQNRAANVERLREQQTLQAREQARVQTQTIVVEDKGFHFGPEQSGLIMDSPQSMDEETTHRQPFKPNLREPEWQMISPPSSSASSVATKRSPSSSASSVQTNLTRPSVDEGDAALQAAVEISIARQISISRQQRQLLKPRQLSVSPQPGATRPPVQTGPGLPTGGPRGGLPPMHKLGKNDRVAVAETRFATPRFVVPRETLTTQLAQHRKSERVVLEG